MKAAALPVTLGLVLLALLRRRTALREPSDVASQVDAVLALLLQPTRTRAEEARLAAQVPVSSLPPVQEEAAPSESPKSAA